MAKVHFICRKQRYLTAMEVPVYEIGYFVFTDQQAGKLLNGTLYLHEKKSEPSFIGGVISSYRIAKLEEPNPGQIVFTFTANEDCKNIPWEGDHHPMAWMGGILE